MNLLFNPSTAFDLMKKVAKGEERAPEGMYGFRQKVGETSVKELPRSTPRPRVRRTAPLGWRQVPSTDWE